MLLCGRMELPVILTPGEEGYLVAECPVIPGCISQGRTREEALRNIREAIELCLENQETEGWLLPRDYEIVRLAVAEPTKDHAAGGRSQDRLLETALP